jgi:excisionase family DNA binding protein
MTDPAILTISDLVRRWRCDRHTVLHAIHSGKLRAFKLGKRTYRVKMEEVIRYEEAA